MKKTEGVEISLDASIEDLSGYLSVRAIRCLGAYSNSVDTFPGVKTVRELVQMRESDLLKRRGLGKTTVREIKEVLATVVGLELGVPHEKCIVFSCQNHKDEGKFVGDLCGPCHEFIVTGRGDVAGSSAIYRSAVDQFITRLGKAVRILLFKFVAANSRE